MTKKHILVTGGAGYIGSHITKMLTQSGYHPIILDNLSTGNKLALTSGTFIEGDLANTSDLKKIFTHFPIEGVIHFAAFIDVGESVINPAKYYHNNVVNTLNLLSQMLQHQVKKIVFSSTAAIFGLPHQPVIDENHPKEPINPYGETKLTVEKILKNYDEAYGIKSIALRYFNAAGGDPEGKIKNYKNKESNLIPIILRSLLHHEGKITINGSDYDTPDGTCIRDYIHIEDLGSAHLLALDSLLQNGPSRNYNLGNGRGFSILEVIKMAEEVTGKKVEAHYGPRRKGDPAILLANSTKIKSELGWNPRYTELKMMVQHAWQALN